MAVSMQATPATMQQGIREIVDIPRGDMKVQDPRWRELALQVNPEILEHAHNVQKTVQGWFDPSLNLEPRLEKHEPRVQQKLGQGRGFWAMNDWTGFRKTCDGEAFEDSLDQIEQVVVNHGGFVALKPIDSQYVKEGHDRGLVA